MIAWYIIFQEHTDSWRYISCQKCHRGNRVVLWLQFSIGDIVPHTVVKRRSFQVSTIGTAIDPSRDITSVGQFIQIRSLAAGRAAAFNTRQPIIDIPQINQMHNSKITFIARHHRIGICKRRVRCVLTQAFCSLAKDNITRPV